MRVEPTAELRADVREAVVRIAREAVLNASRHGRATAIGVWLSSHGGLRLRIDDNGSGFEVDRPGDGGSFGLRSMRERAERIGGTFHLVSAPGRGTQIEATLP